MDMGWDSAATRVFLTLACASIAIVPSVASADEASAALGSFSQPFAEPDVDGHTTDENCVEHTGGHHGSDEPYLECKPSAGSMAVLPTGEIVYFNALEGTENVKNGVAAEFGTVSINDQTRVLDLAEQRWFTPHPVDSGANPDGYDGGDRIPGLHTTETYNDGALFCADLEFLPDGRILAVGGTAYYAEPGNDALPYGIAELEGTKNARIFDPHTRTWTQSGSMTYGRWYPSMVSLGDGSIFVAGGVQKLIKPIYPSHPQDSGRNVVQTETYDPQTGEWTYNGASADRTLPLFPRLHLLPNGHVYYDAAGQVFNPAGQSYDEPLWNIAAAYDPGSKTWTNLGVPGIGTTAPGFRGSTFSLMLPLRPAYGEYTSAEFLTAGGVLGVTPGSYLAVKDSSITTVSTDGEMSLSTRATGPLTNARWYSTGVVLPTGQVAVFSGANRDEVVGPGTAEPVATAELFDPATETWTALESAHQPRTYHNTAALLPDGRILVGGHAPIPTLYGSHMTLPGMSPNEGRDPTFEIFSPPYLFWGDRPEIVHAPNSLETGDTVKIVVDGDAADITSVMLVRNTSITHLIDGDQRAVELQIVSQHGHVVEVAMSESSNVVPAGPYMLFVNRLATEGQIPSVAAQVFVR